MQHDAITAARRPRRVRPCRHRSIGDCTDTATQAPVPHRRGGRDIDSVGCGGGPCQSCMRQHQCSARGSGARQIHTEVRGVFDVGFSLSAHLRALVRGCVLGMGCWHLKGKYGMVDGCHSAIVPILGVHCKDPALRHSVSSDKGWVRVSRHW